MTRARIWAPPLVAACCLLSMYVGLFLAVETTATPNWKLQGTRRVTAFVPREDIHVWRQQPRHMVVAKSFRGGALLDDDDDDNESDSDETVESENEVDDLDEQDSPVRVAVKVDHEDDDDDVVTNTEIDDEEEEEESPKKKDLDAGLAAAAMKSTLKTKAKVVTSHTSSVKSAVNQKLSQSKPTRKNSLSRRLHLPYIVRAFLNPFTVFAMTRAYWASLFDLNYGQKEASQELRSALEEKAKKGGSSPSAGGRGKRKMKPGQAKTLSDLPQLST